MSKGYFVAGTDTGVGKTSITTGLMQAMLMKGVKVAGMKPIASGCDDHDGVIRSEDTEMIMAQASVDLDYDLVNPYRVIPPVSPNIGAKLDGLEISISHITQCYEQIAAKADVTLVEGVGGWMVPISDTETMEDVAKALNLPVILVVAIRLGCINHAILTANAIRASGLEIKAWVANMPDRNLVEIPQVINTLQDHINAPSLGIVPPFIGSSRPTAFSFLEPQLLLD